MPSAHLEQAFEDYVVAHLTAHGWHQVPQAGYDRGLGLFPDEVSTFVEVTQAKAWQQIAVRHGGSADVARTKFARRLADELTSRGTVDVLRRGVVDLGIRVDLLYPEPAHGLSPERRELFDANRCAVVRQLHHSTAKPHDSLDLTLVVNGLPVATAELKSQTTGQTVEHAVAQYRADRDPHDLLLAQRALVHFAVGTRAVQMTTRLAGEDTVFLPFNQGSEGAGRDGGRGNPDNPDGHASAHLWEQVWERSAWLDLLAAFVHVEEVDDVDPRTGKHIKRRKVIFPRYHQWHAVRTLLAEARGQGPGRVRLVQHSAGSGKSNTIAWLAHGLMRLHSDSDRPPATAEPGPAALGPDEPVFHKTVVVTDRLVLDRQLQATIFGFSHQPGTIVKSTRARPARTCARRWRACRPRSSSRRCRSSASSRTPPPTCGARASPSSSTRRTPARAGSRPRGSSRCSAGSRVARRRTTTRRRRRGSRQRPTGTATAARTPRTGWPRRSRRGGGRTT